MTLNCKKFMQAGAKVAMASLVFLIFITSIELYRSDIPALHSNIENSKAYYSSEGKLLRMTLSGDDQYRLWVSLDDIPTDFQNATLQYEDQYFYSHYGVNFLSLLRATYTSYFTNGRRMGASTITMQLARLRFGLRTKSISGKLSQIWQALILERHYSKQQILEAYLNLAPYGHNIQGIGAASLTYFHKNPKYLTTAEALLLAVVPQNPNARLPSTKSGLKNATEARERLIEIWLQNNDLAGVRRSNLSLPLEVHSPNQLPYRAPHFVDQLIKQQNAQNASMRQHSKNTKIKNESNAQQADGLATTLSLKLQRKLAFLTKSYIDKNKSKGLNNAAVMVIDYTDMSIKAEVGSADYFDKRISGQVNGTQALRSPGSTLKPFIFALGLDQGLIHPSSLLKDTPKRFNAYTPENYDKQFVGPLSARDALVRSRNIPAVALMQQLANPNFHNWLSQAKPRRLEPEAHYGLALALGGNEVSMLELMQWYATLANRGYYSQATRFTQPPEDKRQKRKTRKKLLSAESSFLTLHMLSSNPSPTKQSAHRGLSTANATRQDIPWKTGTSFAFRDAWSIGVVGNYVVGVWVGNFDGSANPALIGRTAAGPLFFQIAEHLQQTNKGTDDRWRNTAELNLKKIDICASSGDLETDHCPNVQLDWFIPGVSPFKSNNVYREISIDTVSGLRACRAQAENTRMEIYEFWPSDITQVFRNAGIDKKKPPPFMPECDQYVQISNADAPTITSPSPKLNYALQSDRLSREQIPLTATVASDASKLYWFIDNEFIGQTTPEVALLWNPKQGEHSVTVIDDIGRSSESSVHTMLVN